MPISTPFISKECASCISTIALAIAPGPHNIGIPKGSVVKTGGKDFSVGSLEGLGLYLNGCDLPQEIYVICDVNELIGQLENSLGETGRLFSWMELNDFTALYFYLII